jgi:hypothetical protein
MARTRTLTARTDIRSAAADLNELIDLAAAKDIDVALMIGEGMARRFGIAEADLPVLAELRTLIAAMNTRAATLMAERF